jgi:selT/selW/selH-like putative selenoprotein
MQVSQLVAQRFPGVEVIGSSYPLPVFNQAAATAVVAGRNVALAVALAGDQIFGFFNMPTPPWYTANIVPNRMGWCLGAWFLGNAGYNMLTATHAFEIYANGQMVFSKLAAGRLPTGEELMNGLGAALRAERRASIN